MLALLDFALVCLDLLLDLVWLVLLLGLACLMARLHSCFDLCSVLLGAWFC